MEAPAGSHHRRSVTDVHRLVVKVGSSSLVDGNGAISARKLEKVVGDVARAVEGRQVVLVSSGAIASGLGPLGLARKPSKLAALQAAAAVGQGRLMAEYTRRFARRGMVAAQVLLTQDDVLRRGHFVRAQQTLEHLLGAGVVPVVNENDTVATEEITFGDNDRLAALVAIMVRADLLILLSDVDGIYTADPRRGEARLLPEVADPMAVRASRNGSPVGSGGMESKLQAALLATAAGIPVAVAGAARRDVLERILAGDPVGTWLPARAGRQRARKAWLAFVMEPRGRIVVDPGAERAVREAGRSLLGAGVVGVEGAFAAGDPVEVSGVEGAAFARGLARVGAAELSRFARDRGEPRYQGEVIHRDELVITVPL
jgi:glutamate 5-kinase